MDRRTYLRVGGAAGAGLLAGCLDSRATASGEFDVGMSTEAFKPMELTVAVGDEVVWRNTSKQGHTVTAYAAGLPNGAKYFASGGYESEQAARDAWPSGFGGRLVQGDTYSHTFEVPGEHAYFCIPHENAGMVGSVLVEDR